MARIIEDQGDAVLVETDTGERVRVAKKGLPASLGGSPQLGPQVAGLAEPGAVPTVRTLPQVPEGPQLQMGVTPSDFEPSTAARPVGVAGGRFVGQEPGGDFIYQTATGASQRVPAAAIAPQLQAGIKEQISPTPQAAPKKKIDVSELVSARRAEGAGPSGGPMGAATQFALSASRTLPRAQGGGGVSDLERRLEKSYEQQKEAAIAAEAAGRVRAEEERGYLQGQFESRVELEQQRQSLLEDYRRRREEGAERLREAQARLEKGPDPTHFWASRTSNQKLMAGLGMALGALGGEGRGMSANDVILDAVKRDLDQQNQNLQAGVKGRESVLAIMKQSFSDDYEALKASEVAMLQQVQDKLAIAKVPKDAESKAKLDALNSQIEQEKLNRLDQLKNSQSERALRQSAAAKNYAEIESLKVSASAKAREGEAFDRGRFVPTVGLALTDKEADRLREGLPKYGKAKDIIGRLREFRATVGTSISPAQRERANSIATQLKLALKDSEQTGALDKGSLDVLDALAGGSPAQIGNYLPAIDELERGIDDAWRENIKAKTISPERLPEAEMFLRESNRPKISETSAARAEPTETQKTVERPAAPYWRPGLR